MKKQHVIYGAVVVVVVGAALTVAAVSARPQQRQLPRGHRLALHEPGVRQPLQADDEATRGAL